MAEAGWIDIGTIKAADCKVGDEIVFNGRLKKILEQSPDRKKCYVEDLGPAPLTLDIYRSKVKPNNQGKPGPIGNTTGIIVPDTAPNPNGNSAPPIKPTPKEEGWWKRWGSGVVHGALDIAGFVPVLGTAAGVIGAGIYVAEGDYVSAAFDLASAVPIGGAAAKAGKLAMKAGEKLTLSAEKQAAKKLAEMEAKKLAELEAKKLAEKEAKEAAKKAEKGGQR